jgi:hypothetical protein
MARAAESGERDRMSELRLFTDETRAQLIARLTAIVGELDDAAVNSLSAFGENLVEGTRQRRGTTPAGVELRQAARIDPPLDPLDRARRKVHAWATDGVIEQRSSDSGLGRSSAHRCTPPTGTQAAPPGLRLKTVWRCDCGQRFFLPSPAGDAPS